MRASSLMDRARPALLLLLAGAFLAAVCSALPAHHAHKDNPLAVRLVRRARGAAESANSPKKVKPKKAKAFEAECLSAHNELRALHGAGKLEIDAKLAAFAQKRADFIAESDGVEFRHPNDLEFGENLAWHSRKSKSCKELVKMWYDEIELYDFDRAMFDHETGHFTQLVWASTKRVGCARAFGSGPKGGVYLVCNYDPPGNFLGEARENVFKRKSRVAATTTTTTSSTTTSATTRASASTSSVAPTTVRPQVAGTELSVAQKDKEAAEGANGEREREKKKKKAKRKKKGNKKKDKKKEEKKKAKKKGKKKKKKTATTTPTSTNAPPASGARR